MSGLTPNWNPQNSAATYSANEINQILTTEYMDSFDFWQWYLDAYSVMWLNEDRNFVVTELRGNPFLVQPHKACTWSPLGGITFDQKEYRPCKTKINTEQCYDELFNSIFAHFLSWNDASPVMLNEEGQRLYNTMTNVILQSAVQGMKLTNTLGKFFDKDLVGGLFNANTPTNIQEAFKATIADPDICAGYLYLIKELGETHDNANVDFDSVVEFTNKGIVGDIQDVIDLVEDNMPYDLSHIYRSGGETYMDAMGTQRRVRPVFMATPDWMNFIQKEYRKQDNQAALVLNRERAITMINVDYLGMNKRVYSLNDVIVMPIEDTIYADKYLEGEVSAFFLTTTGNIAMGSSFSQIKSLRNADRGMGLRIQYHEDNDKYGRYSVLGHMLVKNVVQNVDLISGSVKYRVEPKEVIAA